MTERKPKTLAQPVEFIEGEGILGDFFDLAPRPIYPKDLSAQELASAYPDDSPPSAPLADIQSLEPSSNLSKSNQDPVASSGSSESSTQFQNSPQLNPETPVNVAKDENPKPNS